MAACAFRVCLLVSYMPLASRTSSFVTAVNLRSALDASAAARRLRPAAARQQRWRLAAQLRVSETATQPV